MTAMRLYNTLTRSEQDFEPGPDQTVRMYTCGLTTYARGHIGISARSSAWTSCAGR